MSAKLNIELPPYRGPYENYKTDLGIGILGFGKIVKRLHMPAYKLAGFNVVAATAKSQNSLDAAKAEGIEKVYPNYKDLINDEDVNVIDCTVHHAGEFEELRLDILKECAKAGKHILIQKPLATSIKVAEEMVKIAEDGGIFLAVNQQSRFNPVPYAIKGLLSGDYLGQAGVIDISNIQRFAKSGQYMPFGDFVSDINFPIHHCDLVRWWAGSKPVNVFATMANNAALVTYEFENGTRSQQKELGAASIEYETPINIWAEKGALKGATQWNLWCNWAKEFLDVKFADVPSYVKNLSYIFPGEPYNPYNQKANPYEVQGPLAGFIGIMADFMNSVSKNETPMTNGKDNILSMKMWIAAQESAVNRKVIEII
jgi:predicted dehydrogenase